MKKQLTIILVTVLLNFIGLGIVLPILPFIVEGYGFSEFYVGLTYAIFFLGMFIGGLIFGRLSDKIGRNKTLEITILLTIVGYVLFGLSTNMYMFMLARFIGGLGASTLAIGQAYISDVSNDDNRTQNIALVSAMVGIGFMTGPVIGGILSELGSSLNMIGFVSAVVSLLNLFIVILLLPKISIIAHIKEEILAINFKDLHPVSHVLFLVSFVVSLGFSAMQTTFPLLLSDRFLFDTKHIGYMFGYIGIITIIYQMKIIKHVKRLLGESNMIVFGLSSLILGFILFGLNDYLWAVFIVIALIPIGYGTVNPTVASMQAKISPTHVGKILGINASMISLGSIIGPFLAGALYLHSSGLPYIISSVLFFVALVLVILRVKLD